MNFATISTRSTTTMALVTLGLTLGLTLLPVQAMEVAGVSFKPSIQVGKDSLRLSGTGVRQLVFCWLVLGEKGRNIERSRLGLWPEAASPRDAT
jgi:hypothetical protein